MTKNIFSSIFAFTFVFISTNLSKAEEADYYNLIQNKTVLTLSESAQKEVEQDRIKATLRIIYDNRKSSAVQDYINKNMAQALEIAKKYSDSVKTSTGRYNVGPYWNNTLKKNDGWQGSQQIILDSKNKQHILDITQDLQNNGFVVENLAYYLSREKAATYRTELINEALSRVQDRAKSIAKQLNSPYFHIGSIQVSETNASPLRRKEMSLMSVDTSVRKVEAPSVESGEESLAVSIHVSVILDIAQ